ncbi:GNAT family N-acetyltransferase [Streptomyces iconiensis]|uniref:N-acetyltransferase n=1 Tax=Streptomyces iconiensis TaxID=1384038 RepID=A0ABT6ZNM6_9ACTN|nr:N-acetyltransferase [Streptomyces iconiensis]MDJ1130649.1 N-acetyltransferase [Streptomyces iconiensis]
MTAPTWLARIEHPGEAETVRHILLSAFETSEEADLVDALREDENAWLAPFSYVTVSPDDEPVGQALLTRCHIGDTPALALAPCAVLPAYQGKGAGTAAIRGALAAARAVGERTVTVLGHPVYYPRFGFSPASAFGITPPEGQDWPDDAFLALSLDHGKPPRGPIRYAPAFGL